MRSASWAASASTTASRGGAEDVRGFNKSLSRGAEDVRGFNKSSSRGESSSRGGAEGTGEFFDGMYIGGELGEAAKDIFFSSILAIISALLDASA